jgi:hypothetical protein
MYLQEGFQPATFKSSRSERATINQQSLDYFLDEDEKEEANKSSLQVKVGAKPSKVQKCCRAVGKCFTQQLLHTLAIRFLHYTKSVRSHPCRQTLAASVVLEFRDLTMYDCKLLLLYP